MLFSGLQHRQRTGIARFLLLCILLGAFPAAAQAQDVQTASLAFRPHCEETPLATSEPFGPLPELPGVVNLGSGKCLGYPAATPDQQETPTFLTGQTLDMDIVLLNPKRERIRRVRAWLSFDPAILEGVSITPSEHFPLPTPGEADFGTDGLARIAVSIQPSQEGREPSGNVVPIARVVMRIARAPEGGRSPISFYDVRETADGHTYAIAATRKGESTILPRTLGSLHVIIAGGASESSSGGRELPAASPLLSSSSSSSEELPHPPDTLPPPSTPFTLLQVQNLRATTQGSAIFLAWDRLRSSRVAGYNVYYGTQKGRYIQRHTVGNDATSVAIRGLLPKTTYSLAIRAYNAEGEESAFSREVAVTVGDPSSSTSPLRLQGNLDSPHGNPLQGGTADMPGETGAPSRSLLLLLTAAVIGTMLALRRQWIASSLPHL